MQVLKDPDYRTLKELAHELADDMIHMKLYWANVAQGNKRLKITSKLILRWLEIKGYTLSWVWLGQFVKLLAEWLEEYGYKMTEKRLGAGRNNSTTVYIFERVV